MSRTIINFLLDTLLLLILVGVAWTTLVLRFVFPPGTAAEGYQLWGLGFDGWFDVLVGLLILIGMAILVHIMLHWSWVCAVATKRILRWSKSKQLDEGLQTIYGVGLLIMILGAVGLLVAAAALSIQSPA